ncbi:50S ribosomal protein L2p (L8e) [Candidatus Nasuia deltocephalinicola]|nr:50S ribosomal protein L2p (L8e) [Candidatus Nasuia deltocephalinicola]
MSLFFYKPITPGLRGKSKLINNFYKFTISKKFYKIINYKAGRNNLGHITVRHKGGRCKRKYRILDFYRSYLNLKAKVLRIEYDPYRNSNILFISYFNGKKSYIISPKNIKINNVIISSKDCFSKDSLNIGNSFLLNNIPEGTKIHCLENYPGGGAKYSRSSGSFCILISKNNNYANVLLKSGKMKKFNLNCRATIGEVGNEKYNLIKKGKAGVNRLKGIRPTVRGVAMNPVDHPHGGGEGKTSGGRDPVSPWGLPSKGFKTKR